MLSRILVPTDGSKAAQKAARYAVDLAKKTGSRVHLLSVIDKRFIVSQQAPARSSPVHIADTIEDYLRRAAEASMEEIVSYCKKNRVTVKTSVRTGVPVEEILKEAAASKADLIVMGSHGRSALRAAILGSVTQSVLQRDTKIPVLLVRR